MKQLTCEMCGSTDLMKDGGVFVCQSCGCKYSVEEARRMMVEGTVDVTGTVKVDTSDELKNLYELARRAKIDNNSENAQKYYEQIVIKDPSSWEANFYTVYGPDIKGKGGQVRFVKIETKEQLDLLNRLYIEAKAKGLTDDDFIISKTIRYGPRLEKKSIENWIGNHRHKFTDPDRQKKVTPGKKPRIDKLVFHGLRHSYNQNREKRLEGDPRKLQKLSQGLGHRRLAVNDIYRE